MSENYTRVIPPLSTTSCRLFDEPVVRAPLGGDRTGGWVVPSPAGRACCGANVRESVPRRLPLKEPSCQPRTSERQPPFRRSRRSGVPGEQPTERALWSDRGTTL